MKARYGLVILLVAVLALGGMGCNKVTGGGWFTDVSTGHKITFGFNAQPTGDGSAKGQFQLVDHDSKTRIHGTFTGTLTETSPSGSNFWGTCSINGTSDHNLFIWCQDDGDDFGQGSGDLIGIFIYGYRDFSGNLTGGNIQVHKE